MRAQTLRFMASILVILRLRRQRPERVSGRRSEGLPSTRLLIDRLLVDRLAIDLLLLGLPLVLLVADERTGGAADERPTEGTAAVAADRRPDEGTADGAGGCAGHPVVPGAV